MEGPWPPCPLFPPPMSCVASDDNRGVTLAIRTAVATYHAVVIIINFLVCNIAHILSYGVSISNTCSARVLQWINNPRNDVIITEAELR